MNHTNQPKKLAALKISFIGGLILIAAVVAIAIDLMIIGKVLLFTGFAIGFFGIGLNCYWVIEEWVKKVKR